ncbi:ABC transporter ATP-binding protein [Amycolatopsis jejuensis]|uniref:ABC transporter ATP-binding protein n=1 Tax=Amycolatopsis jejuensis TaxID=330084 RepID=UPI00068F2E39|nr:ABC transporter ATP-binding protein [Amycolatopsis jejuensis]
MRIDFSGITVEYRGVPAVREAHLTVPDGAFVAVVGPNGSGKSTLLKTLYRAVTPQSGTARLDNHDIRTIPRRTLARTVGVLGQDQAGGFDFTAREFATLGRQPYQTTWGRPTEIDRSVVDQALDRCGCTEFADRPLSTLSGGERQRVALAQALAQNPRLLVLDEPTNHLDPHHQIAALELATSLGVTVLAALHSLDLAAQYADTVVALHQGRVVASGTPHDVFTEPLLREVFGVAGSMVDDPVTGAPRILLRPLETDSTLRPPRAYPQ